ncbi:MAG TPA: electron transport complex subunit E [Myxococcota bacterium]|nr:electron transport complex subunit E [Myxococcota bacterium]HOC99870.1 electron transport complex subunit E [Myxococcota bacterium]HOH76885.1 electron transport complex subunit E [Myxococcota bacterium]HPV04993.1 electron transport complex subunit E [Myxococcota bacterium]
MADSSLFKEFAKGTVKENPLLISLLGMCPALAVTTSLTNAVGMGAAVIFVLTMSNIVVALLRKIIPDAVRIPAFIVIIASFVTIVDLSMAAWVPSLSKSLGLFIPLIVVNCIILARAEAFAYKNGVARSIMDGVGMGLGYTLGLVSVAFFRELLGNGTLFGIGVLGEAFKANSVLVMILPPGAFLTLGLIVGFMNRIRRV